MKIHPVLLSAAFALTATVMTAGGAQAATNIALITDSASFVSASSVIPQGSYGLTFNYTNMQNNLLTNPPVPATVSNGDTRYIFNSNDSNQSIVIKLGQLSTLTSIGANVQVPSYGDRVVSDFSAEVSTDGVIFTNFGSTTILDNNTVNPVSVSGLASGVQYVRYDFGPSSNVGGSAVYQLFASAVPEPATWAMFLLGFGAIGWTLRGNRRQLAAAA